MALPEVPDKGLGTNNTMRCYLVLIVFELSTFYILSVIPRRGLLVAGVMRRLTIA